MGDGIKQVSIQQQDGTYLSHSFSANAEDIQIDKRHTLADKSEEWNNKLDPIPGKTLSENDFTDKEKEKLDNIEEEAEENIISSIQVNGERISLLNKEANIITPNYEEYVVPKKHDNILGIYGKATHEKYGHVKFGQTEGTAIHGDDERLYDAREPLSHASETDEYGLATTESFGHVKLVDITKEIEDEPGTVPTVKSILDLYDSKPISYTYDKNLRKLSLLSRKGEVLNSVQNEDLKVINKKYIKAFLFTNNENEYGKEVALYYYNEETEQYEEYRKSYFSHNGNALFLVEKPGHYKYNIPGLTLNDFEPGDFYLTEEDKGSYVVLDIRRESSVTVRVSIAPEEDDLCGKAVFSFWEEPGYPVERLENGCTTIKRYYSGFPYGGISNCSYDIGEDEKGIGENQKSFGSYPAEKNKKIFIDLAQTESFRAPKNIPLVPWSTGTDAQIAAMINGYYDGDLSLGDIMSVWNLGDKRSVNLSAMSATYVGESHEAQTIELQIIDFDHDDLATPINGIKKALITVDQKDCLMDSTGYWGNERGYLNSTDSVAGYWRDCSRRKWCNEVYFNALPSYLKYLIKPVIKWSRKKLTTEFTEEEKADKRDNLLTTVDKCFYLAEVEYYNGGGADVRQEGFGYSYYILNKDGKAFWKKPYYHDFNSSSNEYGYYFTRTYWDNGSNATYFFGRNSDKGYDTGGRAPNTSTAICVAMCL